MCLFYWVAKLMSLLLISMFGFKIDKKNVTFTLINRQKI